MVNAGLPDFGPVQNNISANDAVGTSGGIHAEPWDKFVRVATGRVSDLGRLARWCDIWDVIHRRARGVPLSSGSAALVTPSTLEPTTANTYLVNGRILPDAAYTSVNRADPQVGIEWPISLAQVELSAKDRANPRLSEADPLPRVCSWPLANQQSGSARARRSCQSRLHRRRAKSVVAQRYH